MSVFLEIHFRGRRLPQEAVIKIVSCHRLEDKAVLNLSKTVLKMSSAHLAGLGSEEGMSSTREPPA